MNDKEIQEMFREKNREIIRNNLKLDVERNIEVLDETITNIFNINFDMAIKNIVSMFEDSFYLDSTSIVIKHMNKLKLNSFNLLETQIQIKKNDLLNKINKLNFNDDIDEYYDYVFETDKDLNTFFYSNDLYELKSNTINDLNKFIDSILNENLVSIIKNRIYEYINSRLFGKIEEKVKSEFITRNNNLANKGKESYEKFREISSLTTNL